MRRWKWLAVAVACLMLLAASCFIGRLFAMGGNIGSIAGKAWDGVASISGIRTPGGEEEVAVIDMALSSTSTSTSIAYTTSFSPDALAPAMDGTEALPTVPDAAPYGAIQVPPTPASSSCSFSFPSSTPPLARTVIVNEVAWMGSPDGPGEEWIELRNASTGAVSLDGWTLRSSTGNIEATFGADDRIAGAGFFLLTRTGTSLTKKGVPIKDYTGAMRNAGEDLALIDGSCRVSDFVQASSGWPAGNNETKQTMERAADGTGWQTSPAPGGTPGEANAKPQPLTTYRVLVSFEGSGSASITSDAGGMACAAACVGTYASGTKLTLHAIAGADTVFAGWRGACSGKAACVLAVRGNMDVVAQIHTAASPAIPVIKGAGSSTIPEAEHVRLLIAAVQIAGSSTSNDLVKIYNPSATEASLEGWKLRKRSSTGSESSIREFPAGAMVAPGGYFVWANSAGGFAAGIGADSSSSQTLSANNSIALIDAEGSMEDSVAWGTGTGQYGDGPPYPDNPSAGQLLVRRSENGAMVDTGNNADDFMVQ